MSVHTNFEMHWQISFADSGPKPPILTVFRPPKDLNTTDVAQTWHFIGACAVETYMDEHCEDFKGDGHYRKNL